jgi:predicted ArsR family transcriptional regulator
MIKLLIFSSENDIVEEMTVKELAEKLGIPDRTVKSRIRLNKIEPLRYVGPTAIYDPSILDLIREASPRGRPKKK